MPSTEHEHRDRAEVVTRAGQRGEITAARRAFQDDRVVIAREHRRTPGAVPRREELTAERFFLDERDLELAGRPRCVTGSSRLDGVTMGSPSRHEPPLLDGRVDVPGRHVMGPSLGNPVRPVPGSRLGGPSVGPGRSLGRASIGP